MQTNFRLSEGRKGRTSSLISYKQVAGIPPDCSSYGSFFYLCYLSTAVQLSITCACTTVIPKAAKVIMTDSKRSLKDYSPIFLILGFFVIVQAIALFLSGFMAESGLQVFKDPTHISTLLFILD